MENVKLSMFEPQYDVVPQAIFWRSLKNFAVRISEGEDGLDKFRGASFTIGNRIQFSLRTYAGHPQFTVTLYLPVDVEKNEVTQIIKLVISGMDIAKNVIAWQRGLQFKFGEIKRPKKDRLREPEARILALKIAAQQANCTATTEFIKKEVPNYIEFSEIDLRDSKTRPNEKLWEQIVRNVVSHKNAPLSLFKQGYAIKANDGLTVTEKGVNYLKSIGFLES